MNDDDGEIVGTLDRSDRVLRTRRLRRGDVRRTRLTSRCRKGLDLDAHEGFLEEEVLVRIILPEDRDWMVKTAVFIRYASHYNNAFSSR